LSDFLEKALNGWLPGGADSPALIIERLYHTQIPARYQRESAQCVPLPFESNADLKVRMLEELDGADYRRNRLGSRAGRLLKQVIPFT
jgi:hypothetical protein